MIKINEKFSINGYQHGWELHEKTASKKSEKGYKVDVTYYPNLSMLCCAVIDKSSKECVTNRGILEAIKTTNGELIAVLEKTGQK